MCTTATTTSSKFFTARTNWYYQIQPKVRKMSFEAESRSAPRKFIKRPDDKALKAEIDELNKQIKALDVQHKEIQSQIEKNTSDPKVMERRKELQGQLKEVIQKQGSIKQERNGIQDQIKNVDAGLKRKIAEIQAQTAKNNFKTVGEIDLRINYLDKLIDAGDLRLVDERKYVKEMSSLRKLRKDFGAVEKQQELIDADKARIAELKKKLSSVQNKDAQAEFERVQKELDELSASNKVVTDKRKELFNKRDAVKKSKDQAYGKIRSLRADFDQEFDKFKKLLSDEKKKRDDEYKQQQQAQKLQKRKEEAEKQLAEASVPAFTHEINSIHNLLGYFDSEYVKPAPKSAASASSTSVPPSTANSARKIDFPEDVVVIKKEQLSFVEGSKKKKGKKSTTKTKAFSVDPDVIVALGDLSIPLPTKQEDVASTIDILKETYTALEAKQEEQTKINIEKAKARIAKLEAEADKEDAVEADDVEAGDADEE